MLGGVWIQEGGNGLVGGHLFLPRIPLISHLEDGTSYVIVCVNCSEYLHQGSFNNHKHWDPYDN